MPVKKRYAPAMRGITVAAIVAAIVTVVGGPAVATKVAVLEGARHHHRVAAAVQPIGKCVADPDHIGGSTCEISTYAAADGIHVFLDNYNAYPVKLSTIYADYDDQDVKTTVTTRVPAHSQRQLTLPWGGATTLWVQWVDEFNGQNLGSQLLDRP